MDEADVPVEAMAGPFAELCDRAADVGAQVHLEFMPISCVATLREAWTIVRDADRANGGIVFDTWHFFRGDPDFELLATVPGDRIYCVQIDDAAAEPRASLRDDTNNRLLPGDGDLDLDPCGPRVRRDRCVALGRAGSDFPDPRGHACCRSGAACRRQGSGTDRYRARVAVVVQDVSALGRVNAKIIDGVDSRC